MSDPAKPTTLQKSLQAAKENVVPGGSTKCPSCDKAGLTFLVTQYAALPPQWYRPGQSDWVQEAAPYDQNGYLRSRPLKSSQYVLRRLRQGWLYVYYPAGKLWECYRVQSGGRLLRMAPDLMHAMGVGDSACKRFASVPESMLLTIENPQKHDQVWIGFSDARWTAKVRASVAKDPAAAHMKKITPKAITQSTVMANMGPMQLIGAGVLSAAVVGFQKRPARQTLTSEAYVRPQPEDESRLFQVMKTNNAPWKIEGLLLPLEDDIGIATQLNFFRNCALADIMGNTDAKGTAYTQAERDKMVTAGLIETLPVGEHADDVKKHLDVKAYETFLEKYHRCQDASDDFDNRSRDYVSWITFTAQRGHTSLFDPQDKEVAAHLGDCVADMYEGCGLTKREFDEVLHPQLAFDVGAAGALLWRGVAANQDELLGLFKSGAGKGVESVKQQSEVREQVAFLQEVRKLKAEAMELNEASAHRLLSTIGSRARQLLKTDRKLYRQTFRRMQAVALTVDDVATLQVPVSGGVNGLLRFLRRTNENAKGLSLGTSKTAYNRPLPATDLPAHAQGTGAKVMTAIPKNQEDLGEYLEVLARQWPKGQPMPPEFGKLAELAGAGEDVPKRRLLEAEEEHFRATTPAIYGSASAILGILKLFALRESISELGVELGELRSGEAHWAKLAKAVAEVAAPALGVWQASYEVRYSLSQIAGKGAKSAEYFRMVAIAGRLSFAVSVVEGALGITEGRALRKEGDQAAGDLKIGAGASSVASGLSYYVYTRMVANAGLRAAASAMAHGEAAEIAAGLAATAEVGAAGAEVSVEVPPVAMWLGIASASLLFASWVLDFWSSRLVTSPLQKWADRTLLGSRTNKWGHSFSSTKQQLDALLRIFYSVKLEKATLFSRNALEVRTPVFGPTAELAVDVKAPKSNAIIGRFSIKSADFRASKEEIELENHVKGAVGVSVHAQVKRADEGIGVMIWIGSAKSADDNESRNRWLNVLSPIGGAGVALWTGLPSAEVRYWPDRATYPDFFVDGRSAEEASEGEEGEGPEKGETKPEGAHEHG
jgi:hypothetical protein